MSSKSTTIENTAAKSGKAGTGAKPIPEGMHTVTPHIICADAAGAMDFYKKAFGATEEGRLLTPDGRLMHGMIRIGGSALMLADEWPEFGSVGPKTLKGSPVVIHLYVEDVDAFVAHAVEAGCKLTLPVADMFWGDRYGQLEDPYGHRWSVATHMRDLTSEEITEGAKNSMCG